MPPTPSAARKAPAGVVHDVHPEVPCQSRESVRVALPQCPQLPAVAPPVDLREQQHGLLSWLRWREPGERAAARTRDLEDRGGQSGQGSARVRRADDHRDPVGARAQPPGIDGQRVSGEPGAGCGGLVVEHEIRVAPYLAALVRDEGGHVEGAGHPHGDGPFGEGKIAPGDQLAHRAALVSSFCGRTHAGAPGFPVRAQSSVSAGAMSSCRSTGAFPRGALTVLPQNAESRVRSIVLRTVPLLDVLATAASARLPSFEANAYV